MSINIFAKCRDLDSEKLDYERRKETTTNRIEN